MQIADSLVVQGTVTATGIVVDGAGAFNATFASALATTATPASGTSVGFFIANRAYQVTNVSCIEATFGTSETIDVTKDTGTNAPGAGTSLLTGPMALAVSNTRVVGTLTATGATLLLAAGDRLSLKVGGTVGSAAGLVVSVTLQPV